MSQFPDNNYVKQLQVCRGVFGLVSGHSDLFERGEEVYLQKGEQNKWGIWAKGDEWMGMKKMDGGGGIENWKLDRNGKKIDGLQLM